MKKTILKMAALVMAVLMLAGCGDKSVLIDKDSEQEIEDVKLTYSGYKADTLNVLAIEKAIQSFQEKNKGVTINYEGTKGTAYWEAFDKKLSTGNLEDLFMVNHDYALKLTAQNKLENLADIMKGTKFIPAAASQFVNEDGSVYFLPTAMISFGLYCNLDLLKKHGFEPPKNYGELEVICDYFKKKDITPIIGNNYTTVRTLVLARGMYDIYQQKDYSKTIKKINSGEIDLAEILRPGIEMVGEMFTKGWMDSKEVINTAATSDDLTLFKKGDRPFMFTGTWASPRIVGEGGVDFEYAIYPYPVFEKGSVLVLDIATCMSVNAEGPNKDVAKKFVAHMIDPDVIWEYCDSQSSFTPILGDDRLPSDKALVPQIPYLSNGQNVIGSNFNISLPMETALYQMGLKMMEGMRSEQAVAAFRELLAQ